MLSSNVACFLQANGQAAFFVALFRKDTRDLIMQWVQWALPTSLPLLSLQQTPAHFLQSFVNNRIQSFQDGVDRRAAAQQADPRCADSACHMMSAYTAGNRYQGQLCSLLNFQSLRFHLLCLKHSVLWLLTVSLLS